MIPPFRDDGTLPPRIYDAEDWDEVVSRFGDTPRRIELLAKLRLGLDNLRDAGCPWVLLDGSFVTSKPDPNDVDGCWEYAPGMNEDQLDPCFLLLRPFADRMTMKRRFGMDFFLAGLIEAVSGKPFSLFFQMTREGDPRGIVRLDLAAELVGQETNSQRDVR